MKLSNEKKQQNQSFNIESQSVEGDEIIEEELPKGDSTAYSVVSTKSGASSPHVVNISVYEEDENKVA